MLSANIQSLLAAVDRTALQRKPLGSIKDILDRHNLSDPLVANTALFLMQAHGSDIHRSFRRGVVGAKKHLKKSVSIISFFVSEKARNRTVAAFGMDETFLSAIKSTKGNLVLIGKNRPRINAVYYPVEAARQALKKASIVITKAEAVTPESVIQPVGSELLAELSHARGIPYYCIANSWQTTPYFGFRSPEFSKNRAVHRHEKVLPEMITGIISELGVFSHKKFLKEVTCAFPWILQK